MRKFLLSFALTAFIVLGVSAQDRAVATVRLERTEPVSGQQLNQAITAIEAQQGRQLTSAEKKQVLDRMIDQMLIVQAAEADRNISASNAEVEQAGMRLISQQLQAVGKIPPGAVLTDPMQYRQVVEQQGVSVAEFEETVRNQLLSEKYITAYDSGAFQSIGPATAAELNAEYQRQISEFVVSDSIWFNHIFFDTRGLDPQSVRDKASEARSVYQRLMNTSASFADLVASESEDEASKAKGGLVGPVMKSNPMVEQLYGTEFLDTIFEMDVNEQSEVLRSNVGYHIVRISEKKAAQLLPKDDPDVKTYLEQIIYASKFQRTFDEVTEQAIADLRDRATIMYFGEYQ